MTNVELVERVCARCGEKKFKVATTSKTIHCSLKCRDLAGLRTPMPLGWQKPKNKGGRPRSGEVRPVKTDSDPEIIIEELGNALDALDITCLSDVVPDEFKVR